VLERAPGLDDLLAPLAIRFVEKARVVRILTPRQVSEQEGGVRGRSALCCSQALQGRTLHVATLACFECVPWCARLEMIRSLGSSTTKTTDAGAWPPN